MSTYKFLPKQMKKIIDGIDGNDMDYFLENQQYTDYMKVYYTLADVYKEGERLNEDQLNVLLHPIKIFGATFYHHLEHLNNQMPSKSAEDIANSISSKEWQQLVRLDGDTVEQLVEAKELKLLETIYKKLMYYGSITGFNEGQQEFKDLYESLK